MVNADKAHGAHIVQGNLVYTCTLTCSGVYGACTGAYAQMIEVVFRSDCLFIVQMFILV